ncbi:MAG: hypothetical protein IAF94_05700 [Pirellulaceae bacterium]|nr:hypothetical protein [Pirellulaceae bacterium]
MFLKNPPTAAPAAVRKRLAPEVQVGLIVTKVVGDPVALEADFLSMYQDAVSAKLIGRAHAHGKQIHVWTVNDHDIQVQMIELGVDSVITDQPADVIKLRQSRANLSSPEKLVFGSAAYACGGSLRRTVTL